MPQAATKKKEKKSGTEAKYYLQIKEFDFTHFKDLEIDKSVNQHSRVVISGRVDLENRKKYQDYLSKDNPKLTITYQKKKLSPDYKKEKVQDDVIFKGFIYDYDLVQKVNKDCKLKIRAISYSYLLEKKKNFEIDRKDRVYQLKGTTYKDVLGIIMEERDKMNITFQKSEDAEKEFINDEHPLALQYHEDDWNFLKRICSEFEDGKGRVIIVNDKKSASEKINIKIGVSDNEAVELNNGEIGESEKLDPRGEYKYTKIKHKHTRSPEDIFFIGKKIKVSKNEGGNKTEKMVILRNKIYYEGGILYSDLVLAKPDKITGTKEYRSRDIEGVSLKAEVKKVLKDHTVKVEFLDVFNEYKKSKAFKFPIDRPYTIGHFSPEKGDIVDIFFNWKEEKTATLRCSRTKKDEVDNPPTTKKLVSDTEKIIKLDDEDKSISVIGKKDKVYSYISEEEIDLVQKENKINLKKKEINIKNKDRKINMSNSGLEIKSKKNTLTMKSSGFTLKGGSGESISMKSGQTKVSDGSGKISMTGGMIQISPGSTVSIG